MVITPSPIRVTAHHNQTNTIEQDIVNNKTPPSTSPPQVRKSHNPSHFHIMSPKHDFSIAQKPDWSTSSDLDPHSRTRFFQPLTCFFQSFPDAKSCQHLLGTSLITRTSLTNQPSQIHLFQRGKGLDGLTQISQGGGFPLLSDMCAHHSSERSYHAKLPIMFRMSLYCHSFTWVNANTRLLSAPSSPPQG